MCVCAQVCLKRFNASKATPYRQIVHKSFRSLLPSQFFGKRLYDICCYTPLPRPARLEVKMTRANKISPKTPNSSAPLFVWPHLKLWIRRTISSHDLSTDFYRSSQIVCRKPHTENNGYCPQRQTVCTLAARKKPLSAAEKAIDPELALLLARSLACHDGDINKRSARIW